MITTMITIVIIIMKYIIEEMRCCSTDYKLDLRLQSKETKFYIH